MLCCLAGKSQCCKGSQYFDFQSSHSNTHEEDNMFFKNIWKYLLKEKASHLRRPEFADTSCHKDLRHHALLLMMAHRYAVTKSVNTSLMWRSNRAKTECQERQIMLRKLDFLRVKVKTVPQG